MEQSLAPTPILEAAPILPPPRLSQDLAILKAAQVQVKASWTLVVQEEEEETGPSLETEGSNSADEESPSFDVASATFGPSGASLVEQVETRLEQPQVIYRRPPRWHSCPSRPCSLRPCG